jgi:hypothetical protein
MDYSSAGKKKKKRERKKEGKKTMVQDNLWQSGP